MWLHAVLPPTRLADRSPQRPRARRRQPRGCPQGRAALRSPLQAMAPSIPLLCMSVRRAQGTHATDGNRLSVAWISAPGWTPRALAHATRSVPSGSIGAHEFNTPRTLPLETRARTVAVVPRDPAALWAPLRSALRPRLITARRAGARRPQAAAAGPTQRPAPRRRQRPSSRSAPEARPGEGHPPRPRPLAIHQDARRARRSSWEPLDESDLRHHRVQAPRARCAPSPSRSRRRAPREKRSRSWPSPWGPSSTASLAR